MATWQSGSNSTQPNAPASTAAVPRLALHFVYPRELAGQQVALVNGLVLGREPGPDGSAEPSAVVPHATVSRRHALVQLAFGAPIVSDLESSNGTRVDGAPIVNPTPLVPQSLVRFGDVLAVVDEWMLETSPNAASSLPGNSPQMARVRALLARAAREPSPVLILGETGTGKEWVAAAVHEASGRTGPYLKLSCAELSRQLIESELFGHEKGAFTGAVARHIGLFVAADRGTLFLDEIGELPLDLQAKLLRVLQEGEVRPVGSVQTERTDVRVIAATNVDLARAVDENAFRRDLYARLSSFELHLPALRARRQDILGWLDLFCERWSKERGRPVALQLRPVVAEQIVLHSWPDNLRGLERLVQRTLSLDPDATLGVRVLAEVMPELQVHARDADGSLVPPAMPAGRVSSKPAAAADKPSREEFLAVYEATGRSIRATSKHFGRDRRQVYRWLEQFGVER